MLGDGGGQGAELRPDRAQGVERDIRIGQKLERGAAVAVILERQPVLRRFERRERNGLGEGARLIERGELAAILLAPLRAHAADGDALLGQALVGVVRAQGEAIFRARGEHPIRLGDAAGDEVVDHHPEIAFGAIEQDRRAAGD